MEFKSLSELLIALKAYKTDGILDSRLMLKDGKVCLKQVGLSEVVDADGGYLVSGEILGGILHSIEQKSTLWNKATKFYSSRDGVNTAFIPYVEETARNDASFQLKTYWVEEGHTKTGAKLTFGLKTCKLTKLYGLMYVTDELWSDSIALQGAIDEFVMSEKYGSLVWKIEQAMLTGDGATSMFGIMSAGSHGTIGVAVPNPIIESTLFNYVKALAPATLATSEWYMSKENFNDILDIDFDNPNVLEYSEGSMYLFGMKVNVMEQMVTPNDLMLGDVSQYAIALKEGPLFTKAISIHVQFLTDEKIIRWGIRLNGGSFGSKYTLEDGTEVGTFVIPDAAPGQESSSSSSSSSQSSQSSDSSSTGTSQSNSSNSSSSSSQSSQSLSSASSTSESSQSNSSASSTSESSESSNDITSESSQSSNDITSESSTSNSSASSTSESSESSLMGCSPLFCGNSFTTVTFNETWTATGNDYNNYPTYINASDTVVMWRDTSGYWAISNDAGDPMNQWQSSTDTAVICPDGDVWADEDGIIISGSC